MTDSRLNSIHLEGPRRQDYRHAREVLLRARGDHTLYAEQLAEEADSSPSNTLIQKVGQAKPSSADCWLTDEEYVYPLKVGLNTLGRSSDNDVVVADCFISRRHCAIVVHARRGCELHDTASKNGVFLNGAKLARPTSLRSGDTIRLCDRQFVFVVRGDQRPGAYGITASI